MPKWGIEMQKGILSEWHVQEGDAIEKGQLIALVETDKITNEMEADGSGVMHKLMVSEGEECVVGALSFVKAKSIIPKRSLLAGNPAKVIKQVSDEMITWKTKGTKLYQQLPQDCFDTLKECEPLTKIESNRPSQDELFSTWK